MYEEILTLLSAKVQFVHKSLTISWNKPGSLKVTLICFITSKPILRNQAIMLMEMFSVLSIILVIEMLYQFNPKSFGDLAERKPKTERKRLFSKHETIFQYNKRHYLFFYSKLLLCSFSVNYGILAFPINLIHSNLKIYNTTTSIIRMRHFNLEELKETVKCFQNTSPFQFFLILFIQVRKNFLKTLRSSFWHVERRFNRRSANSSANVKWKRFTKSPKDLQNGIFSPKNFFLEWYLWTPKMQFGQPRRKVFNKSPKIMCTQSRNDFHFLVFFLKKQISCNCSSGHTECPFDNPVGSAFPNVRKLFAQPLKKSHETVVFSKLMFLLRMLSSNKQ